MCVCVCVCVCVYCVYVCVYGWPASSLRVELHPQVEWQATARTLDDSQTLFVLWSSEPNNRRASKGDLVLRGGSLGRSDLVKDQVGWGIAWEKGDDGIADELEERHLFCCWSVLHRVKPVEVGKLKQHAHVYVKRHELFC